MGLFARCAARSCTTDDLLEAPCCCLRSALLGRLLLRYLRERVPKLSAWRMAIVTPPAINHHQSAISPETASNSMFSKPSLSNAASPSCRARSRSGDPMQVCRGSPETLCSGARHQVSLEEPSRCPPRHRLTIRRSLSPLHLFPTLQGELGVATAAVRRSGFLTSGQRGLLCRNHLRATAR